MRGLGVFTGLTTQGLIAEGVALLNGIGREQAGRNSLFARDEASGVEILCVKPGAGSLAVDGRLLELKTAKALPSSD